MPKYNKLVLKMSQQKINLPNRKAESKIQALNMSVENEACFLVI